MNKKGYILSMIFIIVIMFITAVCTFAAYLIYQKTDESNLFVPGSDADKVFQNTEPAILTFDNMFLFIYVGLSLFVIISSALFFHHPALLGVSVFFLIIITVIGAVVSNTFWIFTNDNDEIASVSVHYPKIVYLMNNFPLYLLFMSSAAVVAMFIGFKRA